jgi:hypothetical protein
MTLYKITGIGKKTHRKRVQVYEADTQYEAFEKAYKDDVIIDVAATEIVPYALAQESQLQDAKFLGIDCRQGITARALEVLVEEAKRCADLRIVEELGLEIPRKNLTCAQISDFLKDAFQDRKIRKRYKKLPPTECQLRVAKEKGIKLPWRVTRQKLSALIDEAIQREYDNSD